MSLRCCRCGAPASSSMSFDYEARLVWIEDFSPPAPFGSYPLCERHADRLTPPVSWILTDGRSATPVLPFLREVA